MRVVDTYRDPGVVVEVLDTRGQVRYLSTDGTRIPLQQIAQDGINYGVSIERSSILMAPGNRPIDIVRGGEIVDQLIA